MKNHGEGGDGCVQNSDELIEDEKKGGEMKGQMKGEERGQQTEPCCSWLINDAK